MPLLNIDEFSSFFKGGAKAFLFEWIPSITFLKQDYKFLVKATQVPQTAIEEVVVEYQQIDYKFGGKKVFDDWTITLNVDKDAEIRTDFEKWSNAIHQVEKAKMVHHYPGVSNYRTTETFSMLNGNGMKILTVKLYDAWPKIIGPITLDYSVQDFAQFDVTFSYMYHEITHDIIPGIMG